MKVQPDILTIITHKISEALNTNFIMSVIALYI